MKAKIDREGLRRIYELRNEGLTRRMIAERMGISMRLVTEVLGGRAVCMKKTPEVSQPGSDPKREAIPSL